MGVFGLIVPTPGQTEQEYLANYLSSKGMFNSCNQQELENIDISNAKTEQRKSIGSGELIERMIHELSISF